MTLEYDKFEAWFRSTCTCLEEDEIQERLKVDLQESIDTEGWVFENQETQHDWDVWLAALSSSHSDLAQLRAEVEGLQKTIDAMRSETRPLWHGTSQHIPDSVATCPECQSELYARCYAWHEDNGRPLASGVEVTCIADDETMEHRYFQSDWQPIIDTVRGWCDAADGE